MTSRTLSSNLKPFGRYFWPKPSANSGYGEARARMLCGFSGIIGLTAALHGAHFFLLQDEPDRTQMLLSFLCVFLYFAVPGLWHATKNIVLSSACMILLYFVHTNILLMTDRAFQWHQELFLLGPPVLALFLIGVRASWLATAMSVGNLMMLSIGFGLLPINAISVVIVVIVTLMIGFTLFYGEIMRKEARLIELRAKAEQADREKSDFLAKMSHEIRTPLNGLSGVLQLLDETELTDEQKELVATGRESGRSLMRLINDVLDYSKIAARGVMVEKIPFACKDMLNGVAKAQSAAAKAKGLALTMEVADDVPQWITSDPTRLSQVVNNLVGNAIKFSSDGVISLTVNRDEDMLKICVSDQGIGLTPEAQQRVFNKFEQASSTTARRFGGTGLGLAISKEIVELLGGQIGVDSVPSKGSRFWFTIPLVQADAQQKPPEPAGARLESFESTSILVVEDNRTNQMIVRRFLESMQAAVTLVDAGRPALEACKHQKFDMILMDIQLPDIDGERVTQILRDYPGPNQSTPIVALSANILPEQTSAYLKAGMNACLGKPFRKDELAKVMGELIRSKKARQSAA